MHTNGNGEVAFWRICGGVPHFGRVEIKVVKQVTKYDYYKQVQYMAPLARGEQSDPRTAENADCSGFAARPMESRGLCSWGPHLWWGKERKLRQRY